MTTEIKKAPSKLDTIDSFPSSFSSEWRPSVSRLQVTLDDIFALFVKKGTLTHPKYFQGYFSPIDPAAFYSDWVLVSLLVILGVSVSMIFYLHFFSKVDTPSTTFTTHAPTLPFDDSVEQIAPRVPMDTTPLPFKYENPDSLKHVGADPNLSFEEQRLIDLQEEVLRSKALSENSDKVKQFIFHANLANLAQKSISLANQSKLTSSHVAKPFNEK